MIDYVSHWINLYNKKANQSFYIPENHIFVADSKKGFMTYEVDGDTFYVGLVAGDGRHWNSEIDRLAKKHKCKKILFGTYRNNPAAFTRKYGYKVAGFILEKEVE